VCSSLSNIDSENLTVMQVDKVIPLAIILLAFRTLLPAWQNKFYFKINRNNYIRLEEK